MWDPSPAAHRVTPEPILASVEYHGLTRLPQPPPPAMRMHRTVSTLLVAAAVSAALPRLTTAQSTAKGKATPEASDPDEAHEHAPTLATGVSAGAIHFAGGRAENAMSFIVLVRPLPWLKLSTAPGYAHTTLGSISSTGLTDIPFKAVAVRELDDATWSPSIAGGLETTISPSDSTRALGLGRSAVEASAALSVSPTDRLGVSMDLAHPLTASSGNGSLSVESELSFGRATGSLGLTSELGHPDSAAVLARSVAAGVAYSIRGPLTLTVDGGHGLTSGAPSWTLSIGVGTAFAGVSPLSPTSALKRLRTTLGAKTSATSGYSKSTGGASACKRAGTC